MMRANGQKIRQLRTALCISQLELAVDADVSRRTIQKAEQSGTGISVKTLEKIADALDVAYNEIVLSDEEAEQCVDAFFDWQWRLPFFVRHRVQPIRRAYLRESNEALKAIERMRGNWGEHLDADGMPQGDAVYRTADAKLDRDIDEYVSRYLAIWRKNRSSLMYATTNNQRSGISVTLPVTDSAFERLRNGEITFMDISADDICTRSSNIILDSAVEFSHVRDPSWLQVTDSLSFSMFYQIATLSSTIDSSFRMLSFAASRTNLGRLDSIGFTVRDTVMPKFGYSLCEFRADHSDIWDDRSEKTSNTTHFVKLFKRWQARNAPLIAKRLVLLRLVRSYQWMLGVNDRVSAA